MTIEGVQRFTSELRTFGFDIVQVFNASVYNKFALEKLNNRAFQIPIKSKDDIALLVGNTRLLWPTFVKYVNENNGWKNKSNPLDDYTEMVMERACEQCLASNSSVFYSHKSYRIGTEESLKFLSMQSMAHVSGLAMFHAPSHLCVHPVYGPWIALRAVVTVTPGYYMEHPCLPRIQIPNEIEEKIKEISKVAKTWHDYVEIRRLVERVKPEWSQWSYSEDQILYHYTKNKSVLNV